MSDIRHFRTSEPDSGTPLNKREEMVVATIRELIEYGSRYVLESTLCEIRRSGQNGTS